MHLIFLLTLYILQVSYLFLNMLYYFFQKHMQNLDYMQHQHLLIMLVYLKMLYTMN